MNYLILIILMIIGAMMGSFACCQAWRLRSRGKRKMPKRSVCMNCGHALKWYENVPILSWIMLGGKCKKCGKRIGLAEIVMEVMGALSFGGIFVANLVGHGGLAAGGLDGAAWWHMVMILTLLVVLGILAVYDGKWGELPTALLIVAVVIAVMSLAGEMITGGVNLASLIASIGMLAGLYLALNFFSKGKLVGNGDWLLGLSIGIALADWWLALIVLAISNLLAVIFAVVTKQKKIYFGPFLVMAFVIAMVLEPVIGLGVLL